MIGTASRRHGTSISIRWYEGINVINQFRNITYRLKKNPFPVLSLLLVLTPILIYLGFAYIPGERILEPGDFLAYCGVSLTLLGSVFIFIVNRQAESHRCAEALAASLSISICRDNGTITIKICNNSDYIATQIECNGLFICPVLPGHSECSRVFRINDEVVQEHMRVNHPTKANPVLHPTIQFIDQVGWKYYVSFERDTNGEPQIYKLGAMLYIGNVAQ